MITGRVAKLETMGTLDGPGVRVVVFLQGCILRCAYCHNPALLTMHGGTEYTPQELLETVKRYKPYFEKTGGVTVSGGEPLAQGDFLLEFFKLCKQEGIGTCIDTSGVGFGDFDELLKYTDIVLLDIKHVTEEGFKKLTLVEKDKTERFHNALNNSKTSVWIRQVIVPGITDSQEYMDGLLNEIKKFKNIEKIEFLPFHTMAKNLYKELGMEYRLEGVPSMDNKKAIEMQEKLIEEYKKINPNF
jgi:pyruvate formate lyase activating enzyme